MKTLNPPPLASFWSLSPEEEAAILRQFEAYVASYPAKRAEPEPQPAAKAPTGPPSEN